MIFSGRVRPPIYLLGEGKKLKLSLPVVSDTTLELLRQIDLCVPTIEQSNPREEQYHKYQNGANGFRYEAGRVGD